MENLGYVKLYRKLLENSCCNKPNYAWVWVFMLLRANHKTSKIIWNGKEEMLKPGQFITGREELSRQTGVPTSTIEDILTFYEKRQHQIRQQKTNKFRIITIVNWAKYQDKGTKSDSKSNNQPTSEQQQSNTDKKIKNDKNDKNIAKINFRPTNMNKIQKVVDHYLDITGKDGVEYKKHLRAAKELLTLCDEDASRAKKILDKCKELAIGEWSIYWACKKWPEIK